MKRPQLVLRLFVAGRAPNSMRAIVNAKAMCREHFAQTHKLEIVDVLLHPARALADEILVTPTLLKLAPLPVRRLVGDLSDSANLLLALGVE
jgi:circadian clock protein KaiB